MNPLCIYHGNCADGFGSAWVVEKHFGANVDFHAGVYQQPPPCVTGREVIMVDFSYKRDVLLEMANEANSILILDHHKSAEADLEGLDKLPNVVAVFDMERSGAMMTWNHYFPDKEPPAMIKHIQDRDLWRFEIPGTREYQAALFSYPYDFAIWDELSELPAKAMIQDGAAIERKHHKDIDELIKSAATRQTIAGHDVPVLNAPYFFSSDAGHLMAKGEPFAACYWDTETARVYSLRSSDDGLDVSEIASKFGGGGHRNAAGFSVPLPMFNVDDVLTGNAA